MLYFVFASVAGIIVLLLVNANELGTINNMQLFIGLFIVYILTFISMMLIKR